MTSEKEQRKKSADALEDSERISNVGDESPQVPSDYVREVAAERKRISGRLTCIGAVVIVLINALVICALWPSDFPEDASKYVFWMYVVRKLGFVALDIAATYFAIRLFDIAERLYLPLMMDDDRLRALQGGPKNGITIPMKDLAKIVKGLVQR